MTSKVKGHSGFLGPLRLAALIAALAGAAGSVGLMVRVGYRNKSLFLLALFTIWVLSPFMTLVWANVVSKCWPVPARAALYSVMLILTLCSLAVYGDLAYGVPRAQPAAVFLIVPLGSWLVIALVVLMVGNLFRSRCINDN